MRPRVRLELSERVRVTSRQVVRVDDALLPARERPIRPPLTVPVETENEPLIVRRRLQVQHQHVHGPPRRRGLASRPSLRATIGRNDVRAECEHERRRLHRAHVWPRHAGYSVSTPPSIPWSAWAHRMSASAQWRKKLAWPSSTPTLRSET